MATSPRRKFSAQFKAEAVQMVVQNDRPIAQVAKELQINDGTLGNWVKLYREQNPEPEPALKPSDRVRLAELEAEVRELRMENEFLKKPQPSSPRSRAKRQVSPHFSGEGQLPDCVDVPPTRRGQILILCLACPRWHHHGHSSPPGCAETRNPTGVHFPAWCRWMPPSHRETQRRRHHLLGGARGGFDA